MLDRTALARDEAINEALHDAIWFGDGEGTPSANVFAHRLRKHGLVIVESASHDKLLTTLQLVGSALEPIIAGTGARKLPPGVGLAFRDVVTKIKEL